MVLFVFGLLVFGGGIAFAFLVNQFISQKALRYSIASSIGLLGLILVIVSTAIYVEDNQGGIVIRKFGDDLPPSHIIATNGEKGPQAKVLPPGWHFGYWPWLYTLESVHNQEIPSGNVGVVFARDGQSLPRGEVYAQEWESPTDMLDAVKFLGSDGKEGNGFRGPQLTVLPPGQYRYNPRLYKIVTKPALTVKVGEVVVVKANAGKNYKGEDETLVNGVPIVPNGHRGIWATALTPNQYYLHPDAYEIIHVKTTNRIYSYTSTSRLSKLDRPQNDNSISVRTMDGFEFPVDVRTSAKISAENAPYVVARLADPDADQDSDGFDTLEEIVILPAVRAIFRNSAEQRGALEYVGTRSTIEKTSTVLFAEKLKEYKIDTDGIFVADIGLSKTPEGKELLKTQTDKEVASQQQETWHQKKLAEIARAESVKAQTEADREKDKVDAKVKIEISKDMAQAEIEKAKGQAEATIKNAEAWGGVDNYKTMRMVEILSNTWGGEGPEVLVIGGENGLNAAVLSKFLQEVKDSKN